MRVFLRWRELVYRDILIQAYMGLWERETRKLYLDTCSALSPLRMAPRASDRVY